jgi:WD40 repeat protein
VTSLAVSGDFLYTGSREATSRKIRISTGETLLTFAAHLSVVRDICLRGDRLYTASADGTAKCWDTETGKVVFTLSGQGAAVTTIWVDGDYLFTGSSDGLVRQFEITESLRSPTPVASSSIERKLSVERNTSTPSRDPLVAFGQLPDSEKKLRDKSPAMSERDPFGAFC